VYNCRWPLALNQVEEAFPIANVNFVVLVSGDGLSQSLQSPGGIAFWPEKNGALIVIYTNHRVSSLVEIQADLGPNQPTRSGYQHACLGHFRLPANLPATSDAAGARLRSRQLNSVSHLRCRGLDLVTALRLVPQFTCPAAHIEELGVNATKLSSSSVPFHLG